MDDEQERRGEKCAKIGGREERKSRDEAYSWLGRRLKTITLPQVSEDSGAAPNTV